MQQKISADGFREGIHVHPFVNPNKLESVNHQRHCFGPKTHGIWGKSPHPPPSCCRDQAHSFSSIAAFLTQLNSWKSWVLNYLIGSMGLVYVYLHEG